MTEHKQNLETDILGTDFIKVDLQKFAGYFRDLLSIGSIMHILMASDLTVFLKAEDDGATVTLATLLDNGTPFFDAIAYLSLSDKSSVKITVGKNPIEKMTGKGNRLSIAKSLFFFYFMLLVRGNAGDDKDDILTPKFPRFIYETMGIKGKVEDHKIYISSFDIRKIPYEWLKFVKITNLGIETQQRLRLQVAGHRLFKPFQFVEPKKDGWKKYEQQYLAVKAFAEGGPYWDIHTLTRTYDVHTKLGSINANLNNLMLELYTNDQLADMVKARLIFTKPEIKYGISEYQKYTTASFSTFRDKIFP